MDRKGQWMRAQMRELRSLERKERVFATYILKKEKYSAESIARELGISPNTVQGYLKEIKDNPNHYEVIFQERRNKEIKERKELERKLTRTDQKICHEEIPKGILTGFLICLSALLWWWFPALIVHIGSNNEIEIFYWIYSVEGFLISTIIVSGIMSWVLIQGAIKKREEYLKK